jgi:hypothetical protein
LLCWSGEGEFRERLQEGPPVGLRPTDNFKEMMSKKKLSVKNVIILTIILLIDIIFKYFSS